MGYCNLGQEEPGVEAGGGGRKGGAQGPLTLCSQTEAGLRDPAATCQGLTTPPPKKHPGAPLPALCLLSHNTGPVPSEQKEKDRALESDSLGSSSELSAFLAGWSSVVRSA